MRVSPLSIMGIVLRRRNNHSGFEDLIVEKPLSTFYVVKS